MVALGLGVAAHGGTIRSEYSVLYGAVAFIFFVSGLQLPPAKLKTNATNWRLHIIVQGMSFVMIPCIMLGMAPLPQLASHNATSRAVFILISRKD